MVQIKTVFIIALCIGFTYVLFANSVDSATTMQKGFFGESLVDDIWVASGRKSISDKINPLLHGPDRMYLDTNGILEIHEVKALSSWSGKNAMKTTFDGGKPTYELSKEWLSHWSKETIKNPLASISDINTAKVAQEAMRTGKYRLVVNEINLSTREIRFFKVSHAGNSDIRLHELAGPTKIKYFERNFISKIKKLQCLRENNFAKTMTAPKIWSQQHPLSRDDFESIAKNSFKDGTALKAGIMTSDGRLLVAMTEGAKTGFLIFGIESGIAYYSYLSGDILKPELEEKIIEAAIKGTVVGGCTAAAVFLGATPGGWVILGVSIGGYIITDTAISLWKEHQARKYLTIDDLKAYGIEMDSILAIQNNTTLSLNKDSILYLPPDTTLDISLDSIL